MYDEVNVNRVVDWSRFSPFVWIDPSAKTDETPSKLLIYVISRVSKFNFSFQTYEPSKLLIDGEIFWKNGKKKTSNKGENFRNAAFVFFLYFFFYK